MMSPWRMNRHDHGNSSQGNFSHHTLHHSILPLPHTKCKFPHLYEYFSRQILEKISARNSPTSDFMVVSVESNLCVGITRMIQPTMMRKDSGAFNARKVIYC